MNLSQAKDIIKSSVRCDELLRPAPNFSSAHHTGYICPACGSGTKSGRNSTGAVQYYPEDNTWHCHACHASGDVIDLYQEQNGVTFSEAIKELSKRAGVKLDETKREYSKPEPKNEPTDDPADYIDYYTECADRLETPEALNYLKSRGVTLQMARRFLIGFDPEADPASAPGIAPKENKRHAAARIIIPCTKDFYTNRAIDPTTPRAYKAIDPKGSHPAVFNEGAIYNKRSKYCFIVEAAFDALAVEKTGHAAAALQSCGNGKKLIELLTNRPAPGKVFIICFDKDADETTRAKVEKKAEELKQELTHIGYKAITANICGEVGDPNDALLKDEAAFTGYIEQAEAEAARDELDDFIKQVTSESYKPIKTGLPFFDELTGGTIAQTLTVLQAEPGSGKTILMQQVAESIAANNPDRDTIYLNFEMAKEQMLARALSARIYKRGNIKRTALQILQGYKWTDTDRAEIMAAIDEYRNESVQHIKYNPAEVTAELETITAYIDNLAEVARNQNRPAPLLFVDYLQLLTSAKIQDVKEILKTAVYELKKYAIENNTAVYLISAIARDKSALKMASARDTSNIEYTADVIIGLENYKDQPPEHGRQRMILKVLKSRIVEPGKYSMVYRDGANNIFTGEYNGSQAQDFTEGLDWIDEDEQIEF